MRRKIVIAALAACVGVGSVWAFNAEEKVALGDAAAQAQRAFQACRGLEGRKVTVLPVRGDDGGYVEHLLLGALLKAGRLPVIANDEANPRFREILKSIKWDERQTTLRTIDPATRDELGRLLSTQVFLEASVVCAKNGDQTSAEVQLLGFEVKTKAFVLAETIAGSTPMVEPPPPPPPPEVKPIPPVFVRPAQATLNVSVTAGGQGPSGTVVAGIVGSALRAELLKCGFMVEGEKAPDVTVFVDVAASTFDTSGNWIVLEGTGTLSARIAGAEGRLLGERVVSCRGTRALGEIAAAKTLASAFDAQIRTWAKDCITPQALGVQAVDFVLEKGAAVETAADLAAFEAVRVALTAMPGVRRVALTSQDNVKGVFAYRAVYETAAYPGGFLNVAYAKNAALFKPFEKK